MKIRRVVLSPAAAGDVAALDDWIAGEAGEDIASAYVDRLEVFTARLAHFPHRGSPRDARGTRSVTFERRQIVLYRVTEDAVEILRVIDAHRDLARLLPG